MTEKPYICVCKECGVQFHSTYSATQYCATCTRVKRRMGVYGRTFYKNRLLVLERDEYKCQCCGISEDGKYNNKLIVHHIDINTKNNSPSNLITLCGQCHSSLHKKYTKYILRRSNIYKLFANDFNFGEFGKNLIYGAAKKIVKKQFGGRPKFFFGKNVKTTNMQRKTKLLVQKSK